MERVAFEIISQNMYSHVQTCTVMYRKDMYEIIKEKM